MPNLYNLCKIYNIYIAPPVNVDQQRIKIHLSRSSSPLQSDPSLTCQASHLPHGPNPKAALDHSTARYLIA